MSVHAGPAQNNKPCSNARTNIAEGAARRTCLPFVEGRRTGKLRDLDCPITNSDGAIIYNLCIRTERFARRFRFHHQLQDVLETKSS